jgi:glycosyltransferase 2 family protein
MAQKKIYISLFIGVLFSLVASYFLLKSIPIADTYEYLKKINYWWLVPSLFVGFLSYVLRAVRWRIILSPIMRIGLAGAYHPLVIGFMVNSILPGRVGELARPGILYKTNGTPFSKVLATIIAERIFDIITLMLLFIFFISSIKIDPTLSISFKGYVINSHVLETAWGKAVRIGAVLIVVIGMICIPRIQKALSSAVLAAPGVLFFIRQSHREKIRLNISQRIVSVLESLSKGFEMLRSPVKILECFFLSFVVWVLIALSFYFVILGCPNMKIGFIESFTVLILICFFIMLPSVPGFWGIYEAGGIFGMMIFGIPPIEAAGVILIIHVSQILLNVALGIHSSAVMGVNIFKPGDDSPQS